MAVSCYARAMDHVGVMALDPAFAWLDRVILRPSLRRVLLPERARPAGLWRTGPIGRARDSRGPYPATKGPPGRARASADGGGRRLARETATATSTSSVARGDGASPHRLGASRSGTATGAISRIVAVARPGARGAASPEFASIEEYLGDAHATSTTPCSNASRAAGTSRSETPRTGLRSASTATSRRRVNGASRSSECRRALGVSRAARCRARGWPERLVIALEQALLGGADRASYSREAAISAATASSDFRRLADAGLVTQPTVERRDERESQPRAGPPQSRGRARCLAGDRAPREHGPSSSPAHERRDLCRRLGRQPPLGAQRVSSWRDESCSLRSTFETWLSTVFTDRCSRAAISL